MPGISGHSYVVRAKEYNLRLNVCVGLCVCVSGVHRCMEIICNKQGHVPLGQVSVVLKQVGTCPLRVPPLSPGLL